MYLSKERWMNRRWRWMNPRGWHKSRALEVGVSMRLLSVSLVVQSDDGSDELLRANSTHSVIADGAKLSGEQAKTQKY